MTLLPPGTPTTAVTAVTSVRRRVSLHAAVTLAVVVGAVCLGLRHWPVIATGAGRLAVADRGWLLVAAVA
ncbi:TIGR00374 family protein, partial [Streptomyces mirabilis]